MYRAGSETTLMQPNVLVPWEKYKRQAVSELRDGKKSGFLVLFLIVDEKA